MPRTIVHIIITQLPVQKRQHKKQNSDNNRHTRATFFDALALIIVELNITRVNVVILSCPVSATTVAAHQGNALPAITRPSNTFRLVQLKGKKHLNASQLRWVSPCWL